MTKSGRQLSGRHDDDELPAEALDLADDIKAVKRKTLGSIFEIGDLLIEVRAMVPKGQWLQFALDHLPFKAATARRLMKVASDERLRQESHATHLPICWFTLWLLSTLSDEQFERGLKDGKINPNMKRVDVEVLRGGWKWGESSLPRMASSRFSYKRVAAKPDPRTKARTAYFNETLELSPDEAEWERALCDAHFGRAADDDEDDDDA